jgi:membrane-associated phospholipid phosphatase
MRGGSLDQFIHRGAFWLWIGIVCVSTYLLTNLVEIPHPIPLVAMPELKNVGTMFHLVLRTNPNSSFPSGHAFAYSYFALMSVRFYPRMAVFFGGLFLIMPTIRLVIGIHWLSDILLGALPLAILLVALSWETPIFYLHSWLETTLWRVVRVAELLFVEPIANRKLPFVMARSENVQSITASNEKARSSRRAA